MLTIQDDYLVHYGVKGQKWGVRRYQNEDMSLTMQGREHYGIGKGGTRGLFRVGKNLKKTMKQVSGSVVDRTKDRVSEMRGPKHMSDAELNERIKRMRQESEYNRLKRELEGGGNQNNGGGGKKGGDKKHPYLSKALMMPVAAAIGVGVGALAKEKVNAFLDHRADIKLKTFMETAKDSESSLTLNKLLESARRSAETAGHPMDNAPDVKEIVASNRFERVKKSMFGGSSKKDKFYSKTSVDSPSLNRRGKFLDTFGVDVSTDALARRNSEMDAYKKAFRKKSVSDFIKSTASDGEKFISKTSLDRPNLKSRRKSLNINMLASERFESRKDLEEYKKLFGSAYNSHKRRKK